MKISNDATILAADADNVRRPSGSRLLLPTSTVRCPICYGRCEAKDTADGKESSCCSNPTGLLSSGRNRVDASVPAATAESLSTLPKRLVNVNRKMK